MSVWDNQHYEEEGDGYGSEEMQPCNDCGTPVPKGDELCAKCYNEQLAREEWELLHPESRCPPRE